MTEKIQTERDWQWLNKEMKKKDLSLSLSLFSSYIISLSLRIPSSIEASWKIKELNSLSPSLNLSVSDSQVYDTLSFSLSLSSSLSLFLSLSPFFFFLSHSPNHRRWWSTWSWMRCGTLAQQSDRITWRSSLRATSSALLSLMGMPAIGMTLLRVQVLNSFYFFSCFSFSLSLLLPSFLLFFFFFFFTFETLSLLFHGLITFLKGLSFCISRPKSKTFGSQLECD